MRRRFLVLATVLAGLGASLATAPAYSSNGPASARNTAASACSYGAVYTRVGGCTEPYLNTCAEGFLDAQTRECQPWSRMLASILQKSASVGSLEEAAALKVELTQLKPRLRELPEIDEAELAILQMRQLISSAEDTLILSTASDFCPPDQYFVPFAGSPAEKNGKCSSSEARIRVVLDRARGTSSREEAAAYYTELKFFRAKAKTAEERKEIDEMTYYLQLRFRTSY